MADPYGGYNMQGGGPQQGDPNMQGGYGMPPGSQQFDPNMQGGYGMQQQQFDPNMQGGYGAPQQYDPNMQGGYGAPQQFDPNMQGGGGGQQSVSLGGYDPNAQAGGAYGMQQSPPAGGYGTGSMTMGGYGGPQQVDPNTQGDAGAYGTGSMAMGGYGAPADTTPGGGYGTGSTGMGGYGAPADTTPGGGYGTGSTVMGGYGAPADTTPGGYGGGYGAGSGDGYGAPANTTSGEGYGGTQPPAPKARPTHHQVTAGFREMTAGEEQRVTGDGAAGGGPPGDDPSAGGFAVADIPPEDEEPPTLSPFWLPIIFRTGGGNGPLPHKTMMKLHWARYCWLSVFGVFYFLTLSMVFDDKSAIAGEMKEMLEEFFADAGKTGERVTEQEVTPGFKEFIHGDDVSKSLTWFQMFCMQKVGSDDHVPWAWACDIAEVAFGDFHPVPWDIVENAELSGESKNSQKLQQYLCTKTFFAKHVVWGDDPTIVPHGNNDAFFAELKKEASMKVTESGKKVEVLPSYEFDGDYDEFTVLWGNVMVGDVIAPAMSEKLEEFADWVLTENKTGEELKTIREANEDSSLLEKSNRSRDFSKAMSGMLEKSNRNRDFSKAIGGMSGGRHLSKRDALKKQSQKLWKKRRAHPTQLAELFGKKSKSWKDSLERTSNSHSPTRTKRELGRHKLKRKGRKTHKRRRRDFSGHELDEQTPGGPGAENDKSRTFLEALRLQTAASNLQAAAATATKDLDEPEGSSSEASSETEADIPPWCEDPYFSELHMTLMKMLFFDVDQDETLSKTEAKDFVQQAGLLGDPNEKVDDGAFERFWSILDDDKSGKAEFVEIAKLAREKKELFDYTSDTVYKSTCRNHHWGMIHLCGPEWIEVTFHIENANADRTQKVQGVTNSRATVSLTLTFTQTGYDPEDKHGASTGWYWSQIETETAQSYGVLSNFNGFTAVVSLVLYIILFGIDCLWTLFRLPVTLMEVFGSGRHDIRTMPQVERTLSKINDGRGVRCLFTSDMLLRQENLIAWIFLAAVLQSTISAFDDVVPIFGEYPTEKCEALFEDQIVEFYSRPKDQRTEDDSGLITPVEWINHCMLHGSVWSELLFEMVFDSPKLHSIAFLLVLFRLLDIFNAFHGTMWLPRTIQLSSRQLTIFIGFYFSMIGIFAILCYITFGYYFPQYHTFLRSVYTLVLFSFGYTDYAMDGVHTFEEEQGWYLTMYLLIFSILVITVSMQFFTTIILDAYATSQSDETYVPAKIKEYTEPYKRWTEFLYPNALADFPRWVSKLQKGHHGIYIGLFWELGDHDQ